jgi:phosphatidate cytidylyltransferase
VIGLFNLDLISCYCGIVGTIGDLIESKFKRIAGVKIAEIYAGHGILDRLDSVIFVAPIVFYFIKS